MAIYNKRGVGGKWANKSELREKGVTSCKIVSETESRDSSYQDKNGNPQKQDVCKVQFTGEAEPLNVALNGATIDALIDAYGKDSKNWQGHELAVQIDKLPGKKFPLYLIPEGYKTMEDASGYTIVVKDGDDVQIHEVPAAEEPPF